MTQLVEALRCKAEGRGFDWNFSLTYSFRPHYGPGVDSGIFPGGKDGRCVGLTTLPTSYADCLEMWEPQSAGTIWNSPGL